MVECHLEESLNRAKHGWLDHQCGSQHCSECERLAIKENSPRAPLFQQCFTKRLSMFGSDRLEDTLAVQLLCRPRGGVDRMGTSKAEENLPLRLGLTAVSAMAAESVTFPIDITKTRLQLQGELGATIGAVPKRGAISMAMSIGKEEGIAGLYRGLSPALLRHVFYTSIRIVAYENLRGDDPHNVSVARKAFAGGASGIIGQVIASPADLVKVRMQADGRLMKLGQQPRYTGLADAFTKIARAEGITGLWRGVGPNTQRAFLVNMGELACYDQSKQWIIARGIAGDNIGAHTLASVMSGLSATILSCPADVVKTRMMNQVAGHAVYRNSLDCLSRTVKAEGVMALWKGFFPTWTRLGPWQFVFWVSYEQLRRLSGLSSF